jgi:hypothetical protein
VERKGQVSQWTVAAQWPVDDCIRSYASQNLLEIYFGSIELYSVNYLQAVALTNATRYLTENDQGTKDESIDIYAYSY